MKGRVHKLIGFVTFFTFYFFNLLPNSVNEYLNNILRLFTALLLVYLFSGGRVRSYSFWNFGLSPDNDYHKRMKRNWLIHSAIIPTLLVILFPHPLIIISGFFYTSHVAVDLLNTRSWEGGQYTYIAVFLTVVLFYVMVYS